jgi:hypothetical protein
MSTDSWVKNFFDEPIYALQGLIQTDDPSVGGTVTPSGNLDASAQFGLSAGSSLFCDRKFLYSTVNSGANWRILYINGVVIDYFDKNSFPVLTDIDLGIDTTGRLLFNNNGSPDVVSDQDYVWYFTGISNDINGSATVSFMGNNEYGNEATAIDALESERATVENAFSIKQEFTLIYAQLYQTRNSYNNAVKARIVDFRALTTTGGSTSTIQLPPELINGGNADSLHSHSALNTTYNNALSGLTATEVQSAIDELALSSGGGSITPDTPVSKTSGQTLSTVSGEYNIYAGSLTTGTLLTPVSPANGDEFSLAMGNNVTPITDNGGIMRIETAGGDVVTPQQAFISGITTYRYYSATATWDRVK